MNFFRTAHEVDLEKTVDDILLAKSSAEKKLEVQEALAVETAEKLQYLLALVHKLRYSVDFDPYPGAGIYRIDDQYWF